MTILPRDHKVVVDWLPNPNGWAGRPTEIITGLTRLEAVEIAEIYRYCRWVKTAKIRMPSEKT